MARNAAAGPPSIARWSKVRHACSVGRTAIAPSPTTTGRSRMRPIQRMAALRRVEDRGRDVDGMDAAVRDRERAAGDVGGPERQPSRVRRASSVMRAFTSSSEQRSAPCTTGATRPSGVSTATATLMSAEQLDLGLRHARVEQRMLAECRRDELHDDRGDADPRRSLPRRSAATRSSTSGFTSSSSTEVSWAAVCRLATMRRAIVPRRPRSGIVARPSARRAWPRRRTGPSDAPPPTRLTSRSTIRPPGPEPVIARGVLDRVAEPREQGTRTRRDTGTPGLPREPAPASAPRARRRSTARRRARRRRAACRTRGRAAARRLVLLGRRRRPARRRRRSDTFAPAATSRCT